MAKNRKITETDKAWYESGYLDGEKIGFQRGKQQTIVIFKKKNHELWQLLKRKDRENPVVGVKLTFAEARKLIVALKMSGKSLYRAGQLQKKLKKAEAQILPLNEIIQV